MNERTNQSRSPRLTSSDRPFRLDEFEVHSKLALAIASLPGISRADLSRDTGFARSTVSQLIQPLIDAGLVIEHAAGPSGRGRPCTRLSINPRAGLILVADIGASHGRLVVADLGQHSLAEHHFDVDLAAGPNVVLDQLADDFMRMVAGRNLAKLPIRAVVVGLPSPVDFGRGVCVRPPIMPDWDEFPVSTYLQHRLRAPIPVLVDNDANLMALGEARMRPATQSPLIFAKISTGIGCGIVTADGQLHRGIDGAAGDIGHIRVAGHDDTVCRCGNIGCIEAVASATALLRQLGQIANATPTIEDLAWLIKVRDPVAIRLIRDAATKIGEVMAMLVHILNPATIVLGGRLTRISNDLLAGVRAVVYQRALPLATRSLLIESTSPDRYVGTIGGIVLATEHVLSGRGIAVILRDD